MVWNLVKKYAEFRLKKNTKKYQKYYDILIRKFGPKRTFKLSMKINEK